MTKAQIAGTLAMVRGLPRHENGKIKDRSKAAAVKIFLAALRSGDESALKKANKKITTMTRKR